MQWKLGAASILSLVIGIHYNIQFFIILGVIVGGIVLFMMHNPVSDDDEMED